MPVLRGQLGQAIFRAFFRAAFEGWPATTRGQETPGVSKGRKKRSQLQSSAGLAPLAPPPQSTRILGGFSSPTRDVQFAN